MATLPDRRTAAISQAGTQHDPRPHEGRDKKRKNLFSTFWAALLRVSDVRPSQRRARTDLEQLLFDLVSAKNSIAVRATAIG